MTANALSRFLCSLLALALLAAAPAPATAATLFSDDFGAKPLDSWTPSPLGLASGWNGSAGTATWDGSGHTQLVTGDPLWTDYTLEARFRLPVAQNHPGGLRGRIDPANGAGYAAWIYPSDGVIKLWRTTAWHIDTSGLTLVAQAPVGPIAANVFHTLALSFQGNQISVDLNGTTVIQATDSTLGAGVVALDVSNKAIDFDDVEVAQGSTVLFMDDFSPRPLRRWTASPLGLAGNWDASAGVAASNGGGHTQLFAGDAQWTDYKVEAKVRVTNAADYPGGLRGRVDPVTGGSYAAWIYPGQGRIKLWRHSVWHIDTAPTTVLAEAVVSIPTGAFHTLALTFDGSQIAVSFNGTTVIQVSDATYTAGAVALDVSNQPIDFDDVRVTTLSAPPPVTIFEDDFAGGLTGWTPSPLGLFSNWSGASGTAAYNGGGHTQVWAGDSQWADYRFETKVQVTNAADFPGGLRGRVDTTTGAGYAAWIYPGQGKIKLWRPSAWDIDTQPTGVLAEASVAIAAGVPHTLALDFQGSRIRVLWNGVTVIDVTDATSAAGAIALDVSNQPIEYDDVQVTMAAGTPVDNGPGGPVLVISKAGNPFTRYVGEILLAEGLNHYTIREIGTLTPALLALYDVAILGEMTLTSSEVTLLSDWVDDGGNLIALRPDP